MKNLIPFIVLMISSLGSPGWTYAAITAHISRSASNPRSIEFYTGGLKPSAEASADLSLQLASRLALSASRGETVAFLFRASRAASSQECFRPELRSTTPGLFFRFFHVLPISTEHPSYKGARVGKYWDPLLPVSKVCPTAEAPWILAEVEISPKAKPGQRTLELIAGPDRAPLTLKIWKMAIPAAPAVPLYSELTTWYALLGHYGKWHEGEAPLAARYIESMKRHRIAPLKHWVRPIDLGPERADFATVNGITAPDSFDQAVVKPLPTWAKIPLPFGQDLDPDAPKTAELIRKVALTARKEGWIQRAYAYLWDEPSQADLPRLKRLAALVRREAPDLKILVTTEYDASLAPLVDIWSPILDHLGKNPSPYGPLKRAGKEVWAYSSCVSHGCGNDVDAGTPDWVIDRPGAAIRAQAWIASKYELDALLYYSVVDGYQHFKGGPSAGRDPWKSLWDFSGNGDGTLYYPGRKGERGLTEDQPIESLRLKLWRDSSYDAEYVRWMNALAAPPAWWATERERLASSTTQWSPRESDYASLRQRAGDYLDQLAVPATPKKVKRK